MLLCKNSNEDRTSWNLGKSLLIIGLLLDRTTRNLVTSEVIVPVLYGLDLVEPIIIGGDGVWTFGRWNRDNALYG